MKRWYTFLSTPSGWRATLFFDLVVSKRVCISIHALRVEGDRGADKVVPSVAIFLSTPSGWRATSPRTGGRGCSVYFYPRPPGGGRRAYGFVHRGRVFHFYPRPPGGGRLEARRKDLEQAEFLSTPSGWRATRRPARSPRRLSNFYPRPPGGGRPEVVLPIVTTITISIHALRVEGDKIQHRPAGAGRNFYPRPPGGGRQQGLAGFRWGRRISIHALRVEGDSKAPEFCIRIIISIHALRVEGDGRRLRACRCAGHFYPRPPGGGRHFLRMSPPSGE